MLKLITFLVLIFGLLGCSAQTPSAKVIAEINAGHSENSASDCLKLDVNLEDIRNVINQSELVRGERWHYEHHYPPCSFTGSINHEGRDRIFSYSPTGYLSLEGYEGWYMCYACTVNPEWVSFTGNNEEVTNGADLRRGN